MFWTVFKVVGAVAVLAVAVASVTLNDTSSGSSSNAAAPTMQSRPAQQSQGKNFNF